MALTHLHTTFQVRLPHEVQQYITKLLDGYASTQIVKPKLPPGNQNLAGIN